MQQATRLDRGQSSLRKYWLRIRQKLTNPVKTNPDEKPARIGTSECRVAKLSLVQHVALSLFDRYTMPAWSIDREGNYLDTLNVAARRMTTVFAETMKTEKPPEFTDDERQALVSKAMAMSTVAGAHPTLFLTERANWLVFPVEDPEACCAIVLVR